MRPDPSPAKKNMTNRSEINRPIRKKTAPHAQKKRRGLYIMKLRMMTVALRFMYAHMLLNRRLLRSSGFVRIGTLVIAILFWPA